MISVQRESGEKLCSSRAPTGTISSSVTDNGIACQFADDTKLSGTADVSEGRHTIQKDLNKLKKGAPCEADEIQQSQVQGPPPGPGQSLESIQAGQ